MPATSSFSHAGSAGPPQDWLTEAHRRLLADPRFQFSTEPAAQAAPSDWLQRLLRSLHFDLGIGSYVILFVVLIGVIGIVVRWAMRQHALRPLVITPHTRDSETVVAVSIQPAHFIDQADQSAAQRDYIQAVHLLLLGSLADIAQRRPGLLHPSWTSQEIGRRASLPAAVHNALTQLAATVERGLFGGKAIEPEHYTRCRAMCRSMMEDRSWSP